MSSDSANKVYVSSGVLISFTITDNPNIQPCLWETLTDKDNNINMRFIHTLYGIWRARNRGIYEDYFSTIKEVATYTNYLSNNTHYTMKKEDTANNNDTNNMQHITRITLFQTIAI